MTKLIAKILKGFRDFLPQQAREREKIIEKFKQIFRLFGFEPLETPALEYGETLLGKYGAEADKLLYLFKDRGKRLVGLRYDQTVPLARVVAQYPQLPKPFKRYQIQPVWRAENPQKGRFREFIQCDIDIVGETSLLADSEIIVCALTTFKELGIKNVQMQINDRRLFNQFPKNVLPSIDKLAKIGKEKVMEELTTKGYRKEEAQTLLNQIETLSPTEEIKQLFEILTQFGFKKNIDFVFNPTLVRGLDYYTGIIFEAILPSQKGLSLGGGGRYDNLIALFTQKPIPAVGFAFGFDRIVEVLKEIIVTSFLPETKILIVYFPETKNEAINLVNTLRTNNIPSEIYLGKNLNLEKQLKYADKKGIPYVAIIGPDEVAKNSIKLKEMKNGTQQELTLNDLVNFLSIRN